MVELTKNEKEWESAFNTLEKRVFSADLVKGYDFWEDLEKHVNIESKILDYGCGKGYSVKHLLKKGYKNTYGTDPSQVFLNDLIQEYSNFKLMDSSRIPFPDSDFDVVFCSGVLHHISWDDLINVMNEVNRVLKCGGVFIYAEPRLTIMRRLGHLIVFSPVNIVSKGVKILKDCLIAEWPTYYPWLEKEPEFFEVLTRTNFRQLNRREKMITVIGTFEKL
jgi:ubiquinone/menaquinone biosynthesis C-methylase UbiE